MSDPSTYWLTFINAALGVVTLICCVAVGIGVVQELAARRKKNAALSKLDREVADLVASFTTATRSTSPGSASPWPMAAKSWGRKRNGSLHDLPVPERSTGQVLPDVGSFRKLIPWRRPAGRTRSAPPRTTLPARFTGAARRRSGRLRTVPLSCANR